jgi:hypothetical protein
MLKLSDLEMETPRNENKIAIINDSINHYNTQLGETQKKMEETEVSIVSMKRNVPVEGTNIVLEKRVKRRRRAETEEEKAARLAAVAQVTSVSLDVNNGNVMTINEDEEKSAEVFEL